VLECRRKARGGVSGGFDGAEARGRRDLR